MSGKKYLNLDVELFRSGPGAYRAKIGGPDRDADVVEFVPPLSGRELAAFRRRLPGGQPNGGERVDLGDWPDDLAASKDVGSRLFRALFHDDANGQLALARDAALREQAGVRLRLNMSEAPELARLPWEYLFDDRPDRAQFLALYDATPIVRYLSLGGQSWRSMGVTTWRWIPSGPISTTRWPNYHSTVR